MKNPRYANEQDGILLEQPDGVDLYIDKGPLYEQAKSGEFGVVAPYAPPPEPSPEEVLASERAQAESNRQAAYTQEADPLFFKWQAGEATKEEWEAKRAEIRERFPYPES